MPKARVALAGEDQSVKRETLTDDNGQFSFDGVAPGPFQLAIAAPNFKTQIFSGSLHPGEIFVVPQISLTVATEFTQVTVGPSQVELAETQIKEEEQQRVFAVIPNFYVTYLGDAVPLTSKQKFELAWKATTDPFTFAITAVGAGFQQATNQFGGYGPGVQGYAKRYSASYGDYVSGTFLGDAILPSLFKQDPRYFYRGTGSRRSRLLYALSRSVITRGDNGRSQPNYSKILGDLASGGLSNLYYPANDRSGAGLTFENAAIGLAEAAVVNVFQEFVVRKLTPNLPSRNSPEP